jgi:PAS domain-containing protein
MENNPVSKKPTYNELEQKVEELERKLFEHKKAEKAFQESEVRYKEIVKNSKNGIVVYRAVSDGEDFNIVECNPACEKIEVIKRDDLIGKSVLKVFPGIKDFGLFDVLKRVWQTGKPENHPIAMYNDERISGWRENFVYRLPAGEIVVIYTDETNRMKAEQELKQSYDRMATVLFSLPTGIMIIDAKSDEIIEANPQALLMIGLPLELIAGTKYDQFICQEKVRGPIPDIDTSYNSCEGTFISAHGDVSPIHKTVIPVTLDDRECFIINFVDLTAQKQVESERLQKEKLQGVVEMAGAVCHEISQPLQAVTGLSELLQMEVHEGDPLFNNLKNIQEQADRMSEITKKLMKVTKYKTKGYLRGKIIDIDKATSST